MRVSTRVASGAEVAPLVFKTGGWVIATGGVFLLAGLGLTTAAVAIVTLTPAAEMSLWLRVGLLVAAALPLGAAVLGFLLTLGGEHITLDARTRQVRVRHGRWWCWKQETHAFEDFYAMEVHRQSARYAAHDTGSRAPNFPVRLLSGGDEVELSNGWGEKQARAIGERVADYMGLPLHDETSGEMVVREAGALNESVAARAQRLGEDVHWPKPARHKRITVRQEGDATVLDLPRPSRKMIKEGVVGLVFLLAIYGGVLGGMAYAWGTQLMKMADGVAASLGAAIVPAVLIIPVVYVLLFGVALLVAQERVEITPRAFRRIWLFPKGAWTLKLPADEIEELVESGDNVLLRTDRKTCRVGYTLSKKDRRWLRQAIRYLLVKGAR